MLTVTYQLLLASPLGVFPAQGRITLRNGHLSGAVLSTLNLNVVGTVCSGSFELRPGSYYFVVGNTYLPFTITAAQAGTVSLNTLLEMARLPL